MKVIDLTQTIYDGMPVFPGDPEVTINITHTHDENSWELRELQMGSHTGTHVDAFSHMHAELESLDDLPLEHFFGIAQVVTLENIWPQAKGLFFTEEIGIAYLAKILKARPLFVGGEITEELERALLGEGIITYTNLINLDRLPKGADFTFYGLPLKIKDGDGSPVRAIAILE